jgi:putative flippase GtrA
MSATPETAGPRAQLHALAERVLALVASRYMVVSFLALCTDMSAFFVALALGWGAVVASIAGYCAGIQLHWLLSSRWVFAGRLREKGGQRLGQQSMFVASALLGLALTTIVVAASQAAGMHPAIGKGIAIAASFCLTYLLRSAVVFRRQEPRNLAEEPAR